MKTVVGEDEYGYYSNAEKLEVTELRINDRVIVEVPVAYSDEMVRVIVWSSDDTDWGSIGPQIVIEGRASVHFRPEQGG